ncbi:MAG: M17 family peptidase N-terminal domain-containing protein, partial [Gemmatimonadota bacterium]|nr:M17 family peptidase N-terminal domain-containing protein [Gemmatimonadota bacterium]
MEVEIRAGIPGSDEAEALVVPWFDDAPEADEWWHEAAVAWLGTRAGRGEPADWAELGRDDRPGLFLARLDSGARSKAESVRRAAGAGVRAARERGLRSVAVRVPPEEEPAVWQAAAEGLALGDWRYDALRDAADLHAAPSTRFLCSSSGPPDGASDAVDRGVVLAEAQNVSRELVTLPGNVATPRYLAEAAQKLGSEHGFGVRVWGVDKLREEGFGGLLAVARGSAEEPCFLILDHAGDGGDPHVVVGKGVTFDAGGISIKPSEGMEDMKYDMAGAAAVLGILAAAARLKVPQRVVGLVPATENLPSGTAVKPGDVIRGLS